MVIIFLVVSIVALKAISFPVALFSLRTIRGFTRSEFVIGSSLVSLIASENVSSITALIGTLMSPLRGLNSSVGVIVSFVVKEIELAVFEFPESSSTEESIDT